VQRVRLALACAVMALCRSSSRLDDEIGAEPRSADDAFRIPFAS
jgi:hypothetical protein